MSCTVHCTQCTDNTFPVALASVTLQTKGNSGLTLKVLGIWNFIYLIKFPGLTIKSRETVPLYGQCQKKNINCSIRNNFIFFYKCFLETAVEKFEESDHDATATGGRVRRAVGQPQQQQQQAVQQRNNNNNDNNNREEERRPTRTTTLVRVLAPNMMQKFLLIQCIKKMKNKTYKKIFVFCSTNIVSDVL